MSEGIGEEQKKLVLPMLAGASAGVVARLVCHPIDTIRSQVAVCLPPNPNHHLLLLGNIPGCDTLASPSGPTSINVVRPRTPRCHGILISAPVQGVWNFLCCNLAATWLQTGLGISGGTQCDRGGIMPFSSTHSASSTHQHLADIPVHDVSPTRNRCRRAQRAHRSSQP